MSQVEGPYKNLHERMLKSESDWVPKRAPLSLEIFVIGWRGAQLAMLHTGYRAKPSVFEPIAKTEVKNGNLLQGGDRELNRFLAQNPYWLQPPYARAAWSAE